MLILKKIGYAIFDGFMFLARNWKVTLPLLAVLIAVIVFFGWCGRRQARLDHKEIERAKQAIAEQDRKQMIEILANSDAREAQIDANVAAGREQYMEAVNASRKEHAAKSNDELAAELNRRAQEP